ncbi:hypothetical protein BCR36DRAFT_358664 [Piromyces finnis]|uniref:Uncharacterized protein n=1 Tax=Piromyces finnis TaxID=1754191 RepID=A0A1Y1V2M4_9FUNG|nr:hypothetical protein BCR36DRAFT_358664 [Piromyces finnis]|eukprot:ORX45206.1 hypothetical protein BCR36DRAFT_358664 [Piromyces finnis]
MKIYNFLLVLITLCFALTLSEKVKEAENTTEVVEQIETTEGAEDATEAVEEDTKITKKERQFPEKAFLEQVHYGVKCPEADPEHPYEIDEKFTRIDFHTNSAVLQLDPTVETHNYTIYHTCSPYFYVRYTKGYRFAITSYQFRGTYHIDEGIRAVIKSENTDAVTHVLEGPAMGTFDFTDELDWAAGWRKPPHGRLQDGKLWFGCGTDMIRISVGVQALLNNRLNEEGSGTLVLKDFSANIIWDKCPKEKKKYIPTDEELIRAVVPQPPKKTQEEIKKEKETKATKKLPENKTEESDDDKKN